MTRYKLTVRLQEQPVVVEQKIRFEHEPARQLVRAELFVGKMLYALIVYLSANDCV